MLADKCRIFRITSMNLRSGVGVPGCRLAAWGLLLLLLPWLTVAARGQQEGDFEFQVNAAGAVITRYLGPGGSVMIPDLLGGKPVIAIYSAFSGHTGLTSVTIPDGVTHIGDFAFAGSTGLTDIAIPNSVTYIGDDAFSGCTSLASVTIPSSVTHIRARTFYGCASLTGITIPHNVTAIGDSAFGGSASLITFAVDELHPAYSSAGGALFDKRQLNLVAYPAGKAGPYVIPSSVTGIATSAFSGCMKLTSVTIPNSVMAIGARAFYGCAGLTRVTIPNTVRSSIEEETFWGCSSLTSVSIPNSVYFIHDSAFYGCTSLTSVSIPNSVRGIGPAAFYDCASLTNVTIPNSVTSLEGYAFAGCASLTSIAIPSSITGLPDRTFSGCTSLTNVTIPNSVTSIGGEAFAGCTNLISIIIPNSVNSLAHRTFSGCTGLMSVTIPNSVASIGDDAFAGCTSLTSITVDKLNPAYSSEDGVLFNKARAVLVAYPAGKAGPYTIPNSVTAIRAQAFSSCASLTSIRIPNSVGFIGDHAFRGCTSLTTFAMDELNPVYSSSGGVLFDKAQSTLLAYPMGKAGPYVIPNSVTGIATSAFSGCTKLTSVTIPNSVMAIGFQAFLGCTSLTTFAMNELNPVYSSLDGVLFDKAQSTLLAYPADKAGPYVIPNTVTSIGFQAFYGCKDLTHVTIPSSVTFIGEYAFSGTSLTSITIPSSMTGLPYASLSGCSSLTSVRIPSSVTSIGDDVFSGCPSLAGAYFEGNAPSVGSRAFVDSRFVTVFFRAGTTGWGSALAGRPTALWEPRPGYSEWAVSSGLLAQFPNASAESDDPDGDGPSNHDEWLAGTDPTLPASRLELELVPRPADLVETDRTPVPDGHHALHFRSVPGRYYGVQSAARLGDSWELQAVRVASATQTRFVVPNPTANAFYRVLVLP
jgi:hypothetical protein